MLAICNTHFWKFLPQWSLQGFERVSKVEVIGAWDSWKGRSPLVFTYVNKRHFTHLFTQLKTLHGKRVQVACAQAYAHQMF